MLTLNTITIKDVASNAGVSIKTVSRVVNKESGVSIKTRDKVQAAIKTLGYTPNHSARGLAGKKSYLLGLLYDNPSAAYVLALQAGVLLQCEADGYDLLIHPCSGNAHTLIDDIVSLVKRSRIDGLILTPPLSDYKQLIKALDDNGVKFVRVSPLKEHHSSYVISNEIDAVKSLIRYLISLGHRDIGFITGQPDHAASHWRLRGFKEAMQEANLPISDVYIQQGDFSFESGERCARSMLELASKPTAIFASNDYMAAGVIKVARQMNMSIPRDISIAGFDDAPVASQLWPPLTTIKQPVDKLAAMAAKQLISQIRAEPNQIITEQFACELVIRGTTGISQR